MIVKIAIVKVHFGCDDNVIRLLVAIIDLAFTILLVPDLIIGLSLGLGSGLNQHLIHQLLLLLKVLQHLLRIVGSDEIPLLITILLSTFFSLLLLRIIQNMRR